ncbi:MAG: hypothetical protein NVV60_01450 [Luteimonas sp.]|nr:hypothetical protein [Luteimonas sp.]
MTKIIVKAKTDRGFWRAGRHFTREGVELETSKLKKADLEAIENEPNLVVIPQGKPLSEAEVQKAAEAQERKDAEDKANAEALDREKAALAADEAAWRAAETKAQATGNFKPKVWANLADSDRVARIEAELAKVAQ